MVMLLWRNNIKPNRQTQKAFSNVRKRVKSVTVTFVTNIYGFGRKKNRKKYRAHIQPTRAKVLCMRPVAHKIR